MSQWQIQIAEFKVRVGVDQARDDGTYAQINDLVGVAPYGIEASNCHDSVLANDDGSVFDRIFNNGANPFCTIDSNDLIGVQQSLPGYEHDVAGSPETLFVI